MRGFKGLAPLLLIGLGGLAWLLFMSEPGSQWLTSFLTPLPANGALVARMMALEGSAKRVHGGDVQPLRGPLPAPLDLRDGDRVEIDRSARAVVQLNSQDELQLGELSSVTLQLWNPQDGASPLYLNVTAGEIELQKPGVRGRAYVVRDGRLYLPGQKAAKKPLALTVLRSAPLDMQLAEGADDLDASAVSAGNAGSAGGAGGAGGGGSVAAGGAPSSSAAEPEASAASGENAKPDTHFMGEPETLSNEYIDEMVGSRQGSLQKCWLTRLKDRPTLKGQLVVQFEITRRGKVRDLRIADSNLSDEPLHKCVMTVIERIPFRTFKGPEISLSYPIRFE